MPRALRHSSFLLCVIGLLASTSISYAKEVSFVRDIAPILTRRCEGCHGSKKAEGKYRLDTFLNLKRPGGTEAPPVVAGNPDESELLALITDEDAATRMPRKDDPLSADQVELIRRWIAQGARFDGPDESARLRSLLPPRVHPAPPAAYRVPVPVFALAFSPDGHELAVGGYHELTVWDPATGTLLRRVPALPQRIHDLAYSADGSALIVGGGSPGDYGELVIVHPVTGEKLRTLGVFEDIVLGVAINHRGDRAAAACADGSVRVYDLGSGKLLWEQAAHAEWATAVAFNHDGTLVATASKDHNIKTFDAVTGELFTTYMGHNKQFGKHAGLFEVNDVLFDRSSPLAFSAGEGKAVRIWDPKLAREENGTAADMEMRFAKEGHTKYIEHGSEHGVFRLDLEGDRLFTAARDGAVKEFDVASLKEVRTYQAAGDWMFVLDAHPGTHRLAAAGFDGRVHIWDTESGASIADFIARP